MKKLLLILTFVTCMPTSLIQAAMLKEPMYYGWKDAARAGFLFVGGAWLAYKQLPRMSGQTIEFNAPVFTKVLSSVFFTIGVVGGITGAYLIGNELRKKLNTFKDIDYENE